jgi:hypothetical protein
MNKSLNTVETKDQALKPYFGRIRIGRPDSFNTRKEPSK